VQDPDLWDWVMGHAKASRADWQAIIDDIRSRHRL
jgi:antitoxin CptB